MPRTVLRRNHLRLALAAALVLGGLAAAPADAQPAARSGFAFGQTAIDELGDRLPHVAAAHGLAPSELVQMLRTDETLAVDLGNEQLAYHDHLAPGEAAAEAGGDGGTSAAAPPTTDPVFQLASKADSNYTIYLDFDGHTTSGTSWQGGATIESPPYDTDNDPGTWSSSELSVIERSWKAAAEDFAPFDINVTTIEPPVDDLRKSGPGDTRWGVRVVVTDDVSGLCGCGGIAYIGSFEDSLDEPVFVFNSSLVGVREASSHEVGHSMHLAHDGTSSVTYYQGHGSGETSWAPIMGAAYYVSVSQWSLQEYYEANNDASSANYGNGPDDLAVMTTMNGFGYRADDHGDTAGAATSLVVGTPLATGIVERTTDVDVFSLTTSGGILDIDIDPAADAPNLKVRATLTQGSTVLAESDGATMSASLTESLVAGTYQVTVEGAGVGDPTSSSPTGFTAYGSLGAYTISGTLPPAGPADTEPPAAPTGLTASAADAEVTLDWSPNSESDLADYVVKRSTSDTGPFSEIGQTAGTTYIDSVPSSGTWFYVVVARDTSANESADSAVVSVTATIPVSPDHATASTTAAGAVGGSYSDTWADDGVHQTLTETHSGGKPANRHDRLDHTWTVPVTGGNHVLRLAYEVVDAGDDDAGFDVSWSPSPTSGWIPAGTLAVGTTAASFDLGAGLPSTIYVRVTDTNQTPGQNSNDTLRVDLLELGGGAPPTAPPAQASTPMPSDGATGVSPAPTLSWAPADGATSYEVRLGATAALDGVAPVEVATTSFEPGTLAESTQYYWRVDAVNALGTTAGSTWSFVTTAAATGMSVDSITLTTSSASKGQKYGHATIVVLDSNGSPVSGASVTGRFTGDFGDVTSGTTDGVGSVTLDSTTSTRKPAFGFCVDSVAASGLSWDQSAPFCV